MDVPDDLRYSTDHEWARAEEGRVLVGITDYAQDALCAEVESTKSVSEIYAPVSGSVIEANNDLADGPERLNEDPYGEGWIFALELDDPAQLDELLDAEGYRALIEG